MSEAWLHGIVEVRDRLEAFLRLEEYYLTGSDELRNTIRGRWPLGRKWRIPGFADSGPDRVVFAPLAGADRHGLDPQARLRARLAWHSIENARIDYRDNTIDLCLCYHSALAAGVDPTRLFEETAAISAAPMAGMLREWLPGGRSPEDRSLWAMGYRQVRLPDGVAFVDIGLDDDYEEREPRRLDEWGREIPG